MPCSTQKLADAFVGMGQGQAVGRLGMGEEGGVEVQPIRCLGPIDPPLEMLRLHLVAVDLLAAGLAVEGVQVQPVLAGNER